MRFAAAELPQARRDQLREALRQTRRDSLPLIINARAGRLDVVQAQGEVAFPEKVQLATTAVAIDTQPPDERLKLVDALQQHGPLHVGPPPKK